MGLLNRLFGKSKVEKKAMNPVKSSRHLRLQIRFPRANRIAVREMHVPQNSPKNLHGGLRCAKRGCT